MKSLKSITKSLRDIAVRIAQDIELQKLLISDVRNVQQENYTPLSVNEMLEQHYILLTPQNEKSIQNMGRNTFLIITIQDVNFESQDANSTANGNIFVVTDIDHAMINNEEERSMAIADRLIQDLDNLKLSASVALTITSMSRIAYTETLCGLQIRFKIGEQINQKEVDF